MRPLRGEARLVLRLVAIVVWTVACAAAMVGGRAGAVLAPALLPRWQRAVMRAWAGGVRRILGIVLDSSGSPPRPPFLLVSNHLSYVDVIVLAAVCGGVFVAKSEVRSWPVIGPVCAAGMTLFVDRRAHRDILRVNRAMADLYDRGHGIILFPEGTSSAGLGVLPFRPSLLDFAARRRLPVHVASLSYAAPAGCPTAARTVCWWGDMELVPHLLDLMRLPAVRARLCFGERCVGESNRKALAAALERQVQSLFTPVGELEGEVTGAPILISTNIALLDQGAELLGHLEEETYAATPPSGGSALGAHYRHCLEFYRCFLSGVGSGHIDYDARERDQALESDLAVARQVTSELRARLAELGEAEDGPVSVSEGCLGGVEHASSVGRELLFLISHTVHHYALIAGVLKAWGIEPDEELGVAPSTLAYRRAQQVVTGA